MTEELRQLDAEIAEKVTKLIPCDQWKPINLGSAGGPALMKQCDHEKGQCYSTFINWSVGGIPNYSTDISAAMQVVDRMADLNWQVEMVNGYKIGTHISDRSAEQRLWYARFIDNDNDMNNWAAECDTLPETICRAALKAVAALEAVKGLDTTEVGEG